MICLGLALATVAAYWPVNRAGFIAVDDHVYVTDNPVVQAGLTRDGLAWAFGDVHYSNYFPLTWLSHMLDCQLFGPDPHWHHRVNLLLHVATAVALFRVIRHMTGSEGCSAFAAIVFALHPQHVESVAWVSERKDVLSGLFCVLTLASYAWYAHHRGWARYALTLLLFALGLLSKPTVVTLPCVMLLLDFWPLRRTPLLRDELLPGEPPPEPLLTSLGRLVVEKIPFFLLAAGGSVMTMIAQTKGGAVVDTTNVPISLRAGNALVAYVRYLKKFLWPSDLAAFYPLLEPWPILTVLGAAALLLAVTALSVALWRKRPYLAVGWFWFLGMLVPMIGLVQVGNQAMADRYMYLPMIGLTVMLAWGANEVLRQRRPLAAGAAAVALLLCALVTANESHYWTDSRLLFARTLDRTGPNMFTLQTLAASHQQAGDHDRAIRYYKDCVDAQPRYPYARRALARAYHDAKRYDEARQQYAELIRLEPNDFRSWQALGALYVEMKNWPAAAEHFRAAVGRKPDALDAWVSLAVANRQMGKIDDARRALEQATKVNPRAPHPWYLLGRLLNESGRPADAVAPLTRAVTIAPALADAHYQLGLALMASGRGAEAVAALTEALQANPDSPDAMAKLAWLLATHPDARLRRGADAIALAERANVMTRAARPEILDALAAAMAEQQQFADAAATAATAATLARAAGETKLADQIESRAARYRTRSAVRDLSLAGVDAAAEVPH